MERTPRKILVKGISVIFFIFILVFAYNRFGRYLQGPEIVRISVEEQTILEELYLELYGSVINTDYMYINGRIVKINNDLSFNEVIILSPGKNILDIKLEDSFGKEKKYVYTLYSTAQNKQYETTYQDTQIINKEILEEALLNNI